MDTMTPHARWNGILLGDTSERGRGGWVLGREHKVMVLVQERLMQIQECLPLAVIRLNLRIDGARLAVYFDKFALDRGKPDRNPFNFVDQLRWRGSDKKKRKAGNGLGLLFYCPSSIKLNCTSSSTAGRSFAIWCGS